MICCTVGIMAYNEEKNIAKLLDNLLGQKLESVKIEKICVVASGCTDKTTEIVRTYTQKFPIIDLLIQDKRLGKSSAINLFLKTVKTPYVILESADTLPRITTVELLLQPFNDPEVGMTGCRPLPQNPSDNFMGFTNQLMWGVHHLLSLERPKMGEMVAFKNIVPEIPETSAVDETSIESYIFKKGLGIVYQPLAIVDNHGPENISDFIKQRRRIYAGHSFVRRKEKYSVSTLNGLKIFWLIINNIKLNFISIFWLGGAILLEIYGRLLGLYDSFIRKNNHAVWEIAESTKDLSKKNAK